MVAYDLMTSKVLGLCRLIGDGILKESDLVGPAQLALEGSHCIHHAFATTVYHSVSGRLNVWVLHATMKDLDVRLPRSMYVVMQEESPPRQTLRIDRTLGC